MSNFILNLPELSKKQSIGQLYGASLYLALAEYCQKNTGVKLLIAPDNLAATQIHDGLDFYYWKRLPISYTTQINVSAEKTSESLNPALL